MGFGKQTPPKAITDYKLHMFLLHVDTSTISPKSWLLSEGVRRSNKIFIIKITHIYMYKSNKNERHDKNVNQRQSLKI